MDSVFYMIASSRNVNECYRCLPLPTAQELYMRLRDGRVRCRPFGKDILYISDPTYVEMSPGVPIHTRLS